MHDIEHRSDTVSNILSGEIKRSLEKLTDYESIIAEGVKPMEKALGDVIDILQPLAKEGTEKIKITLDSVPLFKNTLVQFQPYKDLFGDKPGQGDGVIGQIVKFINADDAKESVIALLKEGISDIGADIHTNTCLFASPTPPPRAHTHHAACR